MYDDDMVSALAAAIEEVEIGPFGEDIVEAIAAMERLAAKITESVAAFDKAGMWAVDGATCLTAWLRHRARMSAASASSMSRTARRLRELPVTAAAWRDGSLSSGQVQVVVANVKDEAAELFAEHEAEVVPALVELSVADAASAMQAWAARAKALADPPDPTPAASELHLSKLLDDRRRLDGSYDSLAGAVLEAALRLATSPDAEGEQRCAKQRRADALTDICRFFLDHQGAQPVGRARPHLNVVVDYEDLLEAMPGRMAHGGPVPSETVAALLCDAKVHRVVTQGRSVILDYGTATRTISDALFAALVLRDQHCRHPGCDRPPWWCEGHHVIPVEADGPTNLANLVLKCSRHHHLGHRPGWSEKLEPDGTLVITDPQGRTFTTHPPGVRVPAFAAA